MNTFSRLHVIAALVALASLCMLSAAYALPLCDGTAPKTIWCSQAGSGLPDCGNWDQTDCPNKATTVKFRNAFTYSSPPGGGNILAAPSGSAACWCDKQCTWSNGACITSKNCNYGTTRSEGLYVNTDCDPPPS